jgi:hypothetical protein
VEKGVTSIEKYTMLQILSFPKHFMQWFVTATWTKQDTNKTGKGTLYRTRGFQVRSIRHTRWTLPSEIRPYVSVIMVHPVRTIFRPPCLLAHSFNPAVVTPSPSLLLTALNRVLTAFSAHDNVLLEQLHQAGKAILPDGGSVCL